jgi:hypothetical protein
MPTAFAAVLTTIRPPTESVRRLSDRLASAGGWLVVAGDVKGPASYDLPGSVFLDLQAQVRGPFRIARELPTGHYSRKNIAYLEALRRGAACIYETDDDNAPMANWQVRPETVSGARRVTGTGWVNVYRHFTDDPDLWPRGFPFERLNDPVSGLADGQVTVRAPIQQGLVNGSPDVDAVWRLTQDRAFDFDDRPPLALAPGQWCPFNTQSTWWRPAAFPLLYIPSFCSFRMCDIWRSFVAQRCLWAMGAGVVFHAAEVRQDRNPHDLRRDFEEEIPGYLYNARIADLLSGLALAPGEGAVADNLLACYAALAEACLLPAEERPLVEAWVGDLRDLGSGGAS